MFEPILANFAKHIALDQAETASVLSILKHRKIKKKDALLRAGDVCRSISFVAKGCLRVYHIEFQRY